MANRYSVGFYKEGRYEGAVGGATLRLSSKAEARAVAKRYTIAHANKYDYRAIEFDVDGYLLWEDEQSI